MPPLDMMALPDLSDASPAGENLENDPEFGKLDQAMKGKPEVQYGKTLEPAVPPDWKEASAIARSLMKRTHDLRVLTHMAVAQLHLGGIPALAPVVRTIRAQLETKWDTIHPQLDPEDDLDPMQRSNAVLPLTDPVNMIRALRDTPLVSTPRTGSICWRDIAIMNGTLAVEPGKEAEKKPEAVVVAAFTMGDPARVAAMREAVDSVLEDSLAIPAAFDAQSSPGSGPNYEELTKLLQSIQREFNRYAGAPAAEVPLPDEEPAAIDAAVAGAAPSATAAMRAITTVKSITSLSNREEALHALDLATSYFRLVEPSSPLPMLLDRARRLSSLGFLEILQDLAPGGLSEAKVIAGPTTE